MFSVRKMQLECNESKYFRKCAATITNYFEGGEFENDHRFSKFLGFQDFSGFLRRLQKMAI